MHRHHCLRPAILTTLTILGMYGVPASAQDPVVKPPTVAGSATTRLPAPMPVTARQLPDGRIEVRWPAVEGAIRYDMWRSVPPAGQTAITRANPAENVYLDSDVKVGSTYYYLVAAVNSAGISGLRAGAPPVQAVTAPGSATTTSATQPISARLVATGVVEVAYPASSGATGYRIERVMYRAMATNPAQIDPASQQVGFATNAPGTTFRDQVGTQTASQWVQYRVTPALVVGTAPTMTSPIVMVPGTTATTDGGTGGATGGASTTAATTYAGTTTLTVLAPSPLRVGASVALAAATGVSGARWISLNDSIATVDASGTVTGAAPGTTQVLALASTSDGSARVVAVPVTVAP